MKAYKTSETKRFFYERFDHPDITQKTELPLYDAFSCKLCNCNSLESEHTDYLNLLKNELIREQAVIKMKLSKPHAAGIENHQYLQQMKNQQKKSSLNNFSRG